VERSWLETIQSLGLDVQLGIVLLLFALDGLGTLVRRVAAWRAGWSHRARGRRVLARQPADAETWPPESWRASGGPAG
jgi:hypothetical protein